MKKLLLLFITSIFFFSCEYFEEDPEWYAEIDVVSDIESRIDFNCWPIDDTFYLTGNNTSASLTTSSEQKCWSCDFDYTLRIYPVDGNTTSDLDEYEIGCINFVVRIYKDNNLKQTDNFQLGLLAPGNYCGTSGLIFEGQVPN